MSPTARATSRVTLRKADVAAQLGIAVATLDRWHANGKAPASFKLGRERRYTQDAVDAFLREQQERAQ